MLLQIDELHTLGNKIFENLGIDSRTRNSIVHALVLAELEGIPSLISASRGNEQDRRISIILCEHFYKTDNKIAI